MLIVAIDPGLTGARVIRFGAVLHAARLPLIDVSPKGKQALDRSRMRAEVNDWAGSEARPDLVCLEAVGGLPRQSAPAAFNFGSDWGALREMVEAAGLPLILVSALTWQGATGLSGYKRLNPCAKDPKKPHRDYATIMFPDYAHLWQRRGDDGIADAALMTEYVRRIRSS